MAETIRMRVLVVDDEPLARQLLRSYVEARGDLLLVGEAADGKGAADLIARTQPNLVLLDIEMPGLDGFGLLLELTRRRIAQPHVIFITAFDRYAVRAFEFHAVDYLLKPVVSERFNIAIDRFLQRVTHKPGTDMEHLLEDVLRLPPGVF